MSDDEQTITDAVIPMIKSMALLRKAMKKGTAVDALRRAWSSLENEVLPLLDACKADTLMHYPALLEAESVAILSALPNQSPGPIGLTSDDTRKLTMLLPARILALAIQRRIVPAYNAATLLAFRPGNEEWIRYIERDIATIRLMSGPIGHIFWDPKYLQSLDPIRVERILRVQVTTFSDGMHTLLKEMFFDSNDALEITLIALFLAGVEIPDDIITRTPRKTLLLTKMRSAHGQIELHRRFPTLQHALVPACAPDPHCEVVPPVTEEIL